MTWYLLVKYIEKVYLYLYLYVVLFSETLDLCSFLNVGGHVSHQYETTREIIVLHILITLSLN